MTALHFAVKNKNVEIIKLLLSNDKIDVNIPYILLISFLSHFIFNISLDFKN